jgi:hypothetical protein
LHVWSKARDVPNPFFVLSLECLNNGARIVVGSIIDELMTRCAEQNQIVGRVDIFWARAVLSARTKFTECDYVSVL